MNTTSHEKSTWKSFELLRLADFTSPLFENQIPDKIVGEVALVDRMNDVEFINVWGGRDDPHRWEPWVNNDEPHKSFEGRAFTAFNHFIDIKKGPGIYDDYDGYSYRHGSASCDEFQDASDATDNFWAKLLSLISGMKVDEGINWWFNDEYVHAPGQPWYRPGECSPAMERYSYPDDLGNYGSKDEELAARFPLATNTGGDGRGIPFSVFMPLDNLARYWYTDYQVSGTPESLGKVMHAVQDATIPHHAAGYNGNWHGRYENDLDACVEAWLADPGFFGEALGYISEWNQDDPTPPGRLEVWDWARTPARNWRIDQLVTWLALNAYQVYDQTYNHFRNGYAFDAESARRLTVLAVAMGTLVLMAAA